MRWYINRNGEIGGPYPTNRVKSWLNSGAIEAATLVREEFAQEWVPANEAAKLKPSGSISSVWAIVVVAVLVVGGSVLVLFLRETRPAPVVVESAPLDVRLGRLLKDYADNEIRADDLYKGKTVRVTGTVRDVGKILGSPHVTLTDKEALWLNCDLEASSVSRAAGLNPGASVTVVGRVKGLVLSVNLSECRVE